MRKLQRQSELIVREWRGIATVDFARYCFEVLPFDRRGQAVHCVPDLPKNRALVDLCRERALRRNKRARLVSAQWSQNTLMHRSDQDAASRQPPRKYRV